MNNKQAYDFGYGVALAMDASSFKAGDRVRVRAGVDDPAAGKIGTIVRTGVTGEAIVKFASGREDNFSGFELEKA